MMKLNQQLLFLILPLLFLGNPGFAQERHALGAPINTREHSEFAPTLSADGKTMIFESDRGKGWRLYISKFKAGTWTEPQDLSVINNAIGPDDFLGGPFLTYDGKTLFFTSNMAGSVGGIDIWYIELINGAWTKPKNLGPTLNSKGYDGFPSLSPDGKTLYFMRAGQNKMPSGQQCCEIYYAKRQGKFFINPKPLPYPVNTGCEGYPRIMPDGTTLIFSSFKPEGKGGYDLYQSKYKFGRWSEPVALDFINTPKEDELVSVPGSGDVLYFSGQSNGKEDIFKIEIPKHLRPEQVVTLEGVVRDENNKVVAAQIQVNNIKTGQKIAETENDPETGEYIVLLGQGQKYDIAITAKGYNFDSRIVNAVDVTKSKKIVKNIKLKKLQQNTIFTLNNLFFDFDSASLSGESYFELNRIIEMMTLNPKMEVEISAHTDDKGSDLYNDNLSQKRAESVVLYLTEKGVSANRLVAKGYGKKNPAYPNNNDENRAKNRRVEFKILKMY